SGMFGLWDYNVDKNTLRKLPIKSNVVTSLIKDSRGLVFVGTDGDGVFSYNSTTGAIERFLDNTLEHGRLPNNQVYALACSPRDQLFIGFYRAGASYTVKNSHVFAPYATDSGFDSSQHSIRAIDIGAGYMAVGTRNGLYMLLPKDV
ncbi:MAG: hypothetical protein HUJ83_10110, partial [Veillonella sp.]|nr:hypothetical protein [Veillonella sp.]